MLKLIELNSSSIRLVTVNFQNCSVYVSTPNQTMTAMNP